MLVYIHIHTVRDTALLSVERQTLVRNNKNTGVKMSRTRGAASSSTITPIELTRKDAVFGRGRKKNNVRKGSVYRTLIEEHWLPYDRLPTYQSQQQQQQQPTGGTKKTNTSSSSNNSNSNSNSNNRRVDYVQKNIIDAVLKEGGRFLVREGDDLRQLFPENEEDLREIHSKIRR